MNEARTHLKPALAAGAISLAIFHWLMRGFFPNPSGGVGHDYSYFLPRLVDGYYWWRVNGFFSIPWFTPSFMGGTPFFPNPQSMYYSLPQALCLVMDPLMAVYATVLFFAIVGFYGMYAALAGPFRASPAVCVFGAAIFMFNGFYLSRMIVGHLAFHSFMLAPWIVYFLTRGTRPQGRWAMGRDSAIAGLLFAYMASSGGLAIAPALVASTLMAGLIHIASEGGGGAFLARFTLSGVFSVGITAAKLMAGVSFIGHFPREYPLPGARDILGIIYIAGSALALPTDGKVEWSILTNRTYFMGQHEFDFCISPAPLLFIFVGGYLALRRMGFGGILGQAITSRGASVAGVLLLAMAPLALNYHSEFIIALSKTTPVLKSATTHMRWLAIYIPSAIILSALALERTPDLARLKGLYVAVGLVLLATSALSRNWDYYLQQNYDPLPSSTAYSMARAEGFHPEIQRIGVLKWKDGSNVWGAHPSSGTMFPHGASPIYAYEPIFGYSLERLPVGALKPGAAMAEDNGRFNLKNPACYVYPEENACQPGDHFTIAQRAEADLFRLYQPFPFSISGRQKLANMASIIFILLTAVALAAPALLHRRKGSPTPPSPPSPTL